MHADLFKRADLVVHERDQGRHHHGDTLALAVPGDGRNLIAKALAATCGHQDQGVLPGADVIDDGLLLPPKGAVPKDLLEDGQGRGR